MSLTPGTRLGPYTVAAKIGEGGMGEVWQARDTMLDRDVALKVLPEAFTSDPDRLTRFEREAKILASLNHPNIAQIHGVEESEGTRALVLELVEGPTLADRIKQGPIPLDEALPIAKQIAEALEAAHEQGVIHRDLKPANIKVKEDGTVKLLDFGLAKAMAPLSPWGEGRGEGDDPSQSPTLTAAATQMGMIIGTAAYMSPEQAKGRPVDKRADIWAFGVVLFEMLTGRQAFGRTDISETLASVLKTDLNLEALPADTPGGLRRVLSRCVQKDRAHRSHDIGDVRLDLDEALTALDPGAVEAATVAKLALWQRPVPLTLGALLVAVVSGLAVWTGTRPAPSPPAPITRMSIVLPQTQARTNTGRRGVAISPTGTHVVYVANRQLYLRHLDALEAQPLTGTEGSDPMTPFFSPDGQSVGFFSVRDRALKTVALSGGAAVTLTKATEPYGASWGTDDTIVFGQAGLGVLQVAGSGGTPAEVLVSIPRPGRIHQPQMLTGGEAVLYTLDPDGTAQWDAAQIVVERLATRERTVVLEGSDARYLSTGHLVYALGVTLLAVPFDVDRLVVTGDPVLLVDGVSRTVWSGTANADISRTGALVYLPSGGTRRPVRTLVWVSRDGTEEPLAAEPRDYHSPRLSPDRTRVAIEVRDEEDDIWIWDLTLETMVPLTRSAGPDRFPVWTPNSQRVVFESHRLGEGNLFAKSADGSGAVRVLPEAATHQSPLSMTPNGEWIVLQDGSSGRMSLGLLSSTGAGSWEPLLGTEFDERNGEISPNGQWLAYESTEAGHAEIFVRPFPDVDGARQRVSPTGGVQPLWGPDGRELFYLTEAGVMGVTVDPVEASASFAWSPLGLVVAGPYVGPSGEGAGRSYDIARDGRFLMLTQGVTTNPDDPLDGLAHFTVVLNWAQELLERVPIN